MRRLGLLSILFIFLLVTPAMDQRPISVQQAPFDGAVKESQDRVYGVDMSETIYSMVSMVSYRDFIKKLTENGSRQISGPSTYAPANAYARDWIISELEDLSGGRIETEVIGSYKSVVGRLPGYLEYGPVFMVGGHYDSVNGAPGANDDGTGVAAALELARVMAQYEWPLDIYFGFWNAEEIGLYGAEEVAAEFMSRGIDILMYYNVDMLLVVDPTAPLDERVLLAYNEAEGNYVLGKYWAELTKMMSKNVGQDMIRPISNHAFGSWSRSDHFAFHSAGYDRVMFAHESGGSYDNAYHMPTDTWDNPLYDYDVATELVASVGASMAFTMARAYEQMTTLQYGGSVQAGESREYYFAISSPTSFTVSATWDQDTNFTLYSPSATVLDEFEGESTMMGEHEVFDINLTNQGLYTLAMNNLGSERLLYELEVVYDSDVDGDGSSDSQGYWLDESAFAMDSDSDGLSDAMELIYGTDSSDPDSDDDLMPDGWEVDHGLDPLVNDAALDSDSDGLSNVDEFNYLTDPSAYDTDNDQIPDGWEVANGLDPLTDDSMNDDDGDGLVNLYEYHYRTSPNNADTDSDEIPDKWEIDNGLDPLVNDASEDPDEDGATNLDEFRRGSDPFTYDLPVTTIAIGGAGVVCALGVGFLYYKKKWVHLGG